MSEVTCMLSSSFTPSLSFRNILVSAIAIRVILILYSEWHDAHSVVKYTDVDYRVFSDAANFLSRAGPGNTNRAEGPLKSIIGRELNIGKYVCTNIGL